jgi:hypothetical protein
MSNHIDLIRGTTKALAIDLVDVHGDPLPIAKLAGATATFAMRVAPDSLSNVLAFDTVTTPGNLAFDIDSPVLNLTFQPSDTSSLALALYYYRVQVSLPDGALFDTIPWDLLDLNLGGSATPAPPVFDNTVKITADYPLAGDMQYMTPGGSPIENAQVRVYKKSDYDAGNLSSPIGITQTGPDGKWRQPILVLPGYTYVARLEKAFEFGPDVKEFFA